MAMVKLFAQGATPSLMLAFEKANPDFFDEVKIYGTAAGHVTTEYELARLVRVQWSFPRKAKSRNGAKGDLFFGAQMAFDEEHLELVEKFLQEKKQPFSPIHTGLLGESEES